MNRRTTWVIGAGLVLLALAPFGLRSQFLVNIAMLTAISAALGQAWNISGGFGGLTSFGHSAFFGFGCYSAAILQTRYGLSPWLGLPVGALAGGAVGLVVGWASFRAGLRGSYFALATLAFSEAFRILANSIDYTRAGLGILIPLHVAPESFQFNDRRVFYAMSLALLAGATAVAAWLTRSRFGAQLIAVRENEDAARALGVNVLRTKVWVLTISGALTALGGVLYAQTYLYIDPSIAFGSDRSIEMLLVCMIGGSGTVMGPLLGAIALHVVADTSRTFIDVPGFAPMLYGVVLLLIIAFLPGGIARLRRA